MNAIQQRCRPKHQVLVLKCYPRTAKGAVDVKPNSSELSYLLFYALSRRSKIQKIGSFLEKKTASDAWRLRIGNVQVTLQILTALIEKSAKDAALIAPCVLKILEQILRSNDITMIESSIPTFDAFCEHHDASSLFADQAYLHQYQSVVRAYATLASARSPPPTKGPVTRPVAVRWRNVGLQSIRAITSSDALASLAGRQLDVVVPMVLENLWTENEDLIDVLIDRVEEEGPDVVEKVLRRRGSIATVRTTDPVGDTNPIALSGTALDVDKLAEEDIGVLAMQCLRQIFAVPNRAQMHGATVALLAFIQDKVGRGERVIITDHNNGLDSGWAIRIFEMASRWAPVQERHVILVTAMDTLSAMPMTDQALQLVLTLTSMIGSLLRSDVNLIGLSVMDVMLGLMQRMKSLLQLPPVTAKAADGRDKAGGQDGESVAGLRTGLLVRIQQCVGDLATHVYYADQVSDMIAAILLKVKPSRSASTSSTPVTERADGTALAEPEAPGSGIDSYFSQTVAKVSALRAVKSILLTANSKTGGSDNVDPSRHPVPLRVWEGTHWLLRDSDGVVRKAYADALLTWLDSETTADDLRARDETRDQPGHHFARAPVRSGRELHPAQSVSAANTIRAASTASNRDRSAKGPRSHFLPLLHLAAYDNALQYVDFESDYVLLHVLLAKLIMRLGVNAARYGLGMVFRLQEDIPEADAPIHKVRIGSLCHGYLWALSERFDFDGTPVGRAIHDEVRRRRSKGFWVDGVHVPPPILDLVGTPGVQRQEPKMPTREIEDEALLPFDDRLLLVETISVRYRDNEISSPPGSPTTSPSRKLSTPTGLTLPRPHPDTALPPAFREQMLAEWTREGAIMSIQESSKSESLSGSRAGTTGTRNRLAVTAVNGNGNANANANANANGIGNSNSLHSPQILRPSSAQAVATAHGLAVTTILAPAKFRKNSVRSGASLSPGPDSGKPGVASVEQLKMVLTGQYAPPATMTLMSPDISRLGGNTDDDSGSDSMVSYESFPSILSTAPPHTRFPDVGGGSAGALTPRRPASRDHAVRDHDPLGSHPPEPNAAAATPQFAEPDHERSPMSDVPPVPPLPTTLDGLGKKNGAVVDLPATEGSPNFGAAASKRSLSSRGGDGLFGDRHGGGDREGRTASGGGLDLQELLKGIDSRSGEGSIGTMTRPPY